MNSTMVHYESIAAASSEMLDAARCGNWDALVSAEQRCAAIIAEIRNSGTGPDQDDQANRRKSAIMRRVLAQDAEIRRLLDPRLCELERLLTGAATRRRVDDAYRA